jgi:serine/threonine protein kinase
MALASSHMSRKEKKLLELFQKRPSCLTIDNEEINHGAYGVVVKGSYDKRPVAIKKIHKTLLEAAITNEEIDRLIKSFKEEADMLRSINHPHVVTYFGAFYDPVTREPILVMELMSMNLREYLKKKKGALKTPKQIHICLQIALGLQFFHHMTPPLAHRDLNDKNVLLAEDGTVKIGDLGQSKYKVRKDIYFGTPVPGCFHFMAPETANREDSDKAHYTESVDIFALGVLTMEIATQSGPNPTICGFGILPEVGRRAEDIKKLGDTHPLKPLVLKCLENNYKKRPVIVQIVDELAHLIVHDYTENLQLSRQLEQMKADLSKQKDKKLALVRRVDELSKETSVRRSQQEWLQKQLMDSSNEKAQLNARIEDLKKDVTQKNQEKQHLEKDISQIRQDMEKQKTRVAQFEKSLFERDVCLFMNCYLK